MDWLTRFGPPQRTWLIAALLVQRERQRWHHQVARALDDLDDSTGEAPDLPPGWSYDCHGIGVLLRGPDGEALDVDFNDATGAVIDVWFFANRVRSLRAATTWVAEPRLWQWRPSDKVIVDGVEELVELGAVRHAGSGNKVVLVADLDARAADVTAQLAAPGARDRWIAALEHDHGAPSHAWVRDRLASSQRPGDLLELALRGAAPAEVAALCRPLLARADGNAGHAIQQLRARRDVPVLPEVAALLDAASVTDDPPYAPFQACAYLLERGGDRARTLDRFDAWSQLRAAKGFHGNPFLADHAVLALVHAPDRARDLIRRALRSTTPMVVTAMRTLLLDVDRPWATRELDAAVAEGHTRHRAERTALPLDDDHQALIDLLRARYRDHGP